LVFCFASIANSSTLMQVHQIQVVPKEGHSQS
jgi:hypothetical protein